MSASSVVRLLPERPRILRAVRPSNRSASSVVRPLYPRASVSRSVRPSKMSASSAVWLVYERSRYSRSVRPPKMSLSSAARLLLKLRSRLVRAVRPSKMSSSSVVRRLSWSSSLIRAVRPSKMSACSVVKEVAREIEVFQSSEAGEGVLAERRQAKEDIEIEACQGGKVGEGVIGHGSQLWRIGYRQASQPREPCKICWVDAGRGVRPDGQRCDRGKIGGGDVRARGSSRRSKNRRLHCQRAATDVRRLSLHLGGRHTQDEHRRGCEQQSSHHVGK